MDEYVVTLIDLAHSFGDNPPLWTHVSLELKAGESMAVCGRSGCGKSTLLSIISGWLEPTHGTVCVRDGAKIQWVFQNPYGAVHRSALDIVAYPFIMQGERRNEANTHAKELLEEFLLEHCADQQFMNLSGGEAQRLMLARAIATHPDLLLVDEPTAQLDSHTAELVNGTLRHLSDHGASVMIATHDNSARAACNRVLNLDEYQEGA